MAIRPTFRSSATGTDLGPRKSAVFRSGTWYLDTNNNGILDAADKTVAFGQAGDVPVVGDWRGTGRIALGLFRQGTFITGSQRDTLTGVPTGLNDATFVFGQGGDLLPGRRLELKLRHGKSRRFPQRPLDRGLQRRPRLQHRHKSLLYVRSGWRPFPSWAHWDSSGNPPTNRHLPTWGPLGARLRW